MADPTTNADGTKQVAPPTRSAFGQDTADLKAAAPVKPAASADKDTSAHESGIIAGIKGLIASHKDLGSANKNETSALHALDHGISDTPGNSADY